MIIACLIFYNEEQFLGEWCERIVPFVDRVIAVDGQIKGFPGEMPYSTDNSLALLSAHSPKIMTVMPSEPFADEMEKRSSYLVGEKGDWYVVIDADEMLENGDDLKEDIDRIDLTGYDFGLIRCVGYGAERNIGRLVRHQNGLSYKNRHFWLAKDGNVIFKSDEGPILKSSYLTHLKSERTPERIKQKAMYQAEQAKLEAPYER